MRESILYDVLIVLTAGILGVCAVAVRPALGTPASPGEVKVRRLIRDEAETDGAADMWQLLHAENSDFIAWLDFDSGLISLPVVQGKDNEVYLTRNFDGSSGPQGTVFRHCAASSDSLNQLLYGHTVYYDEKAKFSPLTVLTTAEGLQENSRLRMLFETEERTYDVCLAVYVTPDELEEYGYDDPELSGEKKSCWLAWTEAHKTAGSARAIAAADPLLTLETCRRYDEDTHLVVICRESGRKSIR